MRSPQERGRAWGPSLGFGFELPGSQGRQNPSGRPHTCPLVKGAKSVFEKVEVTSGRAALLVEKVVSAGRLDREFGGRGEGALLKKACREAGQSGRCPAHPDPLKSQSLLGKAQPSCVITQEALTP